MAVNLADIERQWRSEPNNEKLLMELLRHYERLRLETPWDVLAALPRLKILFTLIRNFYDFPLSEQCGESISDITQRELELGINLPKVLREWFRLFGRRLTTREYQPLTLKMLRLESLGNHPIHFERSIAGQSDSLPRTGGALTFYDGLGSWQSVVLARDSNLANPPVYLLRHLVEPLRFPSVTDYLIGMALDSTMMSARLWSPASIMGPLKKSVRGGLFLSSDFSSKQYQSVLNYCDNVRHTGVDFFVWDGETIIAGNGIAGEWACANDHSYQRLKKHMPLDKNPYQ